ncbi:alpha/beta fold hydrolase [Actinorhabdospora filicis]|nr:alpha/beta fold hydrolase [Actinorhabdospora filicis]
MNPHRTAAALGAALLAVTLTAVPAAASSPTVSWAPCPAYSDDVLHWLGVPAGGEGAFRAIMARTDCGTVQVPLDYDRPRGRKITIAFTRVRAADPAHRRGILATNPGGPGGFGYLMPHELALTGNVDALMDEYDVIGIDPRGVNYSTSRECDLPPTRPQVSTPFTEADTRAAYDATVAANAACLNADREFYRNLSVGNEARDMDAVRAALGESRLSFIGVSGGTGLGAAYRSLFPRRVERMWLDSVMPPTFRMDAFNALRSKAGHADFLRFADWAAGKDGGFGDTGTEVVASLSALQADLDAHPRVYTNVPAPVGGFVVSLVAAGDSSYWEYMFGALRELRDATGPVAPPSIASIFASPTPPPPGAPSTENRAMQRGVFCNDDVAPRDFGSTWSAYNAHVAAEPVTGRLIPPVSDCAGWVRPAPQSERWSPGSLVLSGHRYEAVTPYQWTLDMRDAIGGTVVTVEDDVHVSVLYKPGCAAMLVRYFRTGSPGALSCG